MKKILLTVPAFLICLAINAQSNFSESWPNGHKKTEGTLLNYTAPAANEAKEATAHRLSSATKDGKWSRWYENGNLQAEEFYTNGKMTGTWTTLYADGKKEAEINFSNGKAVYYFQSGAKQSEGSVIDGMIQTGAWTGYHENGNKNYQGSYTASGQKTGTWTWFNEKGQAVTEQVFNNGQLVSTKDLSAK